MSISGHMREMIAYDIGIDSYVIRHDVVYGKSQSSFSQMLPLDYTEKMILDAREHAVTELKKNLNEIGISTVSAPQNYETSSKTVRVS